MSQAARAWIGVGALSACVVLGCAQQSPPEAVAPVAPGPVAEAVPLATPVVVHTAMTPSEEATEESAPTLAEAESGPAASAAAYEPPFPDRIDLFVAPKRQGAAPSQGSVENAVELLGFVRVDRPRAVLSINGEIAPLAEGESHFGVEVISVSPPNVVLQRGRQRWQATLQ